MKRTLLHCILLSTTMFMSLHSASISPQNAKRKTLHLKLNNVLPKSSHKHRRIDSLGNKHHQVTGTSRQQISYNLDMINNNGTSSLLYSKDGDAVNGGFTQWTAWSKCEDDCRRTTLRSRERYCTDPSPSNGGADCEGERFQLQVCNTVSCPTLSTTPPSGEHGAHRSLDDRQGSGTSQALWRFGEWSGWSKCLCKHREQKRYRECYNHGATGCSGDTVERKSCTPASGCKKIGKSSLVNVNPLQFCGFNPCDISKCLAAPLGSCVSDYKCRPVFFDEKNKPVEECIGKRIYIDPVKVSQVCKVNPCDYTRCLLDFTEERCVVGTRCQAVYYNPKGEPQTCTAILKVPAQRVCGYDPCSAESCPGSPNARCLVTSKCRPIYVNYFNERIRKCERQYDEEESSKEDEFESEPDDESINNDEDDEDDDDNDADNEHSNGEDDDAKNGTEDEDSESSSNEKNFDDTEEHEGAVDSPTPLDQNIDNFNNHNENESEQDYNNAENEEDEQDDEAEEDEDEHDLNHRGDNIDNFQDSLSMDHDVQSSALSNQDHGELPMNNSVNTNTASTDTNMVSTNTINNNTVNTNTVNTNTFNTNTTKTNSSRPLLTSWFNTENGERRTQKQKPNLSKNINTSSLSVEDIIHGKLKGSLGVISGTVKKSMKIVSNKTPTKFFYFETKEGAGNKTQQVMVITSPKTKKSAILTQKRNSSKTPRTKILRRYKII